MEAAVDLLEFVDLDVGVDGGGVEVFMAEQLLDVADVGASFEHVGGAGVAEEMASAASPEAGWGAEVRSVVAWFPFAKGRRPFIGSVTGSVGRLAQRL